MMISVTLLEVECLSQNILTPAQVASCIGCDPNYIRWEARQNPERLGFPVICVGSRVKIPKEAFLRFMRGAETEGVS